MVCSQVVFFLVVSQFFDLGASWACTCPVHIYHLPKKSHFHRTRTLLFDCVGSNPNSSWIITMYRIFWLGMSHISRDFAKYYALLTIVLEGSELGFSCWHHDKFQFVCANVEHPIEAYGFIVCGHPSHEKMSTCLTSRFGFQKVRCIQMYVHYHVWCTKRNFSILVLG